MHMSREGVFSIPPNCSSLSTLTVTIIIRPTVKMLCQCVDSTSFYFVAIPLSSLGGNAVGDNGAAELCPALKVNSTLRTLM